MTTIDDVSLAFRKYKTTEGDVKKHWEDELFYLLACIKGDRDFLSTIGPSLPSLTIRGMFQELEEKEK